MKIDRQCTDLGSFRSTGTSRVSCKREEGNASRIFGGELAEGARLGYNAVEAKALS